MNALRYKFTRLTAFLSSLDMSELTNSFLLLLFHQTLRSKIINATTKHDKFGGCLRWHDAAIGEIQLWYKRRVFVEIFF